MKKIKKIQALLFAMEQKPDINKTVLMKYIFFIDLVHYNQRGNLLFNTGNYIRLPNGPVDSEAFTLTSESNQYFSVEMRKRKYGTHSKVYSPCHFRAEQPCIHSYFSPYELKLMEMVLKALKGQKASEVSDLTHKLRLWKEFSDGDTIPPVYFILNENEIQLLEKNGIYVDGFQRIFCREMPDIAKNNAEAMHPLKPERISAVEKLLDDMVRKYPLPRLEIFYDAYLAWDDVFRKALKNNPDIAPDLTEKCCDAICYVSVCISSGEENNDKLTEYCSNIEDEFNSAGDEIIQYDTQKINSKDPLFRETMRISRSLAIKIPEERRN